MILFIKNFLRKTNTKYYCLLFTLLFSLLILFGNSYRFTRNTVTDKKEYYTNRELKVFIEEESNFINNINKIDFVSNYYADKFVNGSWNENRFSLVSYIQERNITFLKGKAVTKENEIVLPQEYIDQYGKTIAMKIDNQTYFLNVVGIYRSQEKDNTAFLLDVEPHHPSDGMGYIVLVDKVEHVPNVIFSLNQIGYDSNIASESYSWENMESISLILLLFSAAISVLIILSSILLTRHKLLDNIKEISILKSVGYSSFKIIQIGLLENVIMYISSFILSLIFSIFHFSIYALIYLGGLIVLLLFIEMMVLHRMLQKYSSISLYKW